MKKIYYIGFYSGQNCSKRKNYEANIAGTMKMDFIKSSLKKLGYKVMLLSITMDYSLKKAEEEHIIIDDFEEQVYLSFRQFQIGGRFRGGMKSAVYNLYQYGLKNFNSKDIVIVYHSLAYDNIFKKLKKKNNIKIISQIEEIYCLSNFEGKGRGYLKKERRLFSGADGYLMINENVAKRYSEGKPYVVSYGNYKVFNARNIVLNERGIGLVYTGIINEDRGVFKIIEAMKYLPAYYTLHILGFGSEKNMLKLNKLINIYNNETKEDRIFFYGTKTGKEYTEFLSNYQIGISIMDTSENVGFNAFPSKIMTYLGHSLLVVSSNSRCVKESKISDIIYFTDDSPIEIAKTIVKIPMGVYESPAEKLRECETEFLEELKNLLLNI